MVRGNPLRSMSRQQDIGQKEIDVTVDEIVKAVENLPTDADALDALIGEIRSAYDEIVEAAGDDPTDEQVDQIEALADAMTKARAARADATEEEDDSSEAAAREERASRAAAAAEAFADGPADEDDTVGADGGDADGDEEEFTVEGQEGTENRAEEASDEVSAPDGTDTPEANVKAGDGVQDADTEDDITEDEDDTEDAEAEAEAEKESVAASANEKENGVSRYAGRTKGVQPTPKKNITPFALDAAAPGYRGDDDITLMELAEAFNAVSSGRAIRSRSVGGTTTAQFGHIKRNLPESAVAHDEVSMMEAVEFATDEKNLEGGSLVAAAGWCAPSETIYSFLPSTPVSDLFSLPEIGVARGGLRFPVEPDFSVLFDSTRGTMTEAQAIAGQTKDCIEIPCTDMDEVRMDVLWTCITSNLLANKGWPELTTKFIAEATKGHLHRLSAARLAAVRAKSVAATPGIPEIGTIGTVLNALELHAQDLRLKYRLGSAATIEGVAPIWFKTILRADLAYRDGVLPEQISDAILEARLGDTGIRFQYVADYQTDVIGAGPANLAYPKTVEVILYPSGTFFSAVENVINLGVNYDSTGLAKNQRTEMFVEDGYAVGKRGYESRLLTLPINVNGHVGARVEPTLPGGAAGE